MKFISLVLRIFVALILFQTLFYKFSGAPESVYIFSTLGVEPWGRWFAGISELIAGLLILIPPTRALGALTSLGVMVGAILSHIFVLGIVVQDDGGLLFGMAVAIAIASVIVLIIERQELKRLLSLLLKPTGIKIHGLS